MIELRAQKKKAQARHHCGMLFFKPSFDLSNLAVRNSQDTLKFNANFRPGFFGGLRSHDCQSIASIFYSTHTKTLLKSSVATLLPWLRGEERRKARTDAQ